MNDPVQFSFAPKGKDGVPFPIDRNTFASSIKLLIKAIEGGELSRDEKRSALKRLSANLKIIFPGYSDWSLKMLTGQLCPCAIT